MRLEQITLPTTEEELDLPSSSYNSYGLFNSNGGLRPGTDPEIAVSYAVAEIVNRFNFYSRRQLTNVKIYKIWGEVSDGFDGDILLGYETRYVNRGDPYWYIYRLNMSEFGYDSGDLSYPRTMERFIAERIRYANSAVFEEAIAELKREENSAENDPTDDLPVNPETNAKTLPRNCPCAPCKIRHFETDDSIGTKPINGYSFIPSGGWLFFRKNASPSWDPTMRRSSFYGTLDKDDDPWGYYLGVELETDNYYYQSNGQAVHATLSNDQAADLARPEDFWVAAEDGSVSGPEFKSHPATLSWWFEHREEIEWMLTNLSHAGFRSHDNATAGMHVNFSRNAIDSKEHLARLLKLIHVNASWSLRMSQRTVDQSEHYASLRHGTNAKSIEILAEHMWLRDQEIEKYSALNAPSRGERFEFRLPRGTLRMDRFFKNLEWMVAMIEYSRNHTMEECVPEKLMEIVLTDWREQYPELVAFMEEKMSSLHRSLKNSVPKKKKATIHPETPELELEVVS